MNVFIKTTKQLKTLEIIDPKTNVGWIKDFIGNYGALHDGQFTYDDELDAFICDQETFDWWETVVNNHQALAYRQQELIEKYGSDAVYKALESAGNVDLEDEAASINQLFDEVFGE